MIDKEGVNFKNGTLKGLHREYLLTDGTKITTATVNGINSICPTLGLKIDWIIMITH